MKRITSSVIFATILGLCACHTADIPSAPANVDDEASSGAGGDANNDQAEGGNDSSNSDDPALTPGTAQGFGSLRGAAMERLVQTSSFEAADGVTFISAKGVELFIPPFCLSDNDGMVTGSVDLEYVEIFDRANMLTANKTTMGQLSPTEREILISGGQFYVDMSQDGAPLNLDCLAQFEIPSALTGSAQPDHGMRLFNGVEDAATGELVWEEELKQQFPGEQAGVSFGLPSSTSYTLFVAEFGWSNVDRFASDPGPKTDLLVTVPTGYDDTNSAVYLSYDGETSGLATLDMYDAPSKQFSEHYGRIPVGLACHIIFVSESNGQWVYAIKSATIVDGAVQSVDAGDLLVGSEAELMAAIEQLP